jgi:hypothetical protein
MSLSRVWNFHNYAASNPEDQIHLIIATLKDLTNKHQDTKQDNKRKSKLLYDIFFKPPLDNDHVDSNFSNPPSICKFSLIMNEQISRAITKLSPHKVPGLSGISNSVYMHCTAQLIPYMGLIFQATFMLEIYPDQ